MTKQIHIYLHGKTKDAGNFKEEQHKRDKGGKFSSSGAAGGDVEHHNARAEYHFKQKEQAAGTKAAPGPKVEAAKHHNEAGQHHQLAASALSYAQRLHASGDTKAAQAMVAQANKHAASAHSSHAATLGAGKSESSAPRGNSTDPKEKAAYFEMQRNEQAEPPSKQLAKLTYGILPQDNKDIASSAADLARTYEDDGDDDTARLITDATERLLSGKPIDADAKAHMVDVMNQLSTMYRDDGEDDVADRFDSIASKVQSKK